MTKIVFETVLNFIQIFIWVSFVTEYFGTKSTGIKQFVGFIFAWIVISVETTFLNLFIAYEGFLSIIAIVTMVVYAQFYLKGKFFHIIFASAFSLTIIFTIASAMIFFLSYFTGKSTLDIIAGFSFYRIFGVCMCRILEIVVFSVIIHIKRQYELTKKEWVLFVSMPIMTWAIITFLTNASLKAPETLPYMFYSVFIIVFLDVIIYYFMIKINEDNHEKTELRLLKMQYHNMKETEKNMKALYENTYSVKHDLENYFLTIRAMASASENKSITEYIDSISKNRFGFEEKIVFTSNDIFNAIVNTKLELCRQKRIIMNVNILDEALNYVENEDVTIILGNILDNAIEAAEHSEEKLIILNIGMQGKYISIYVENSFNKAYSNIELKTTKKNKEHGFGIKNVQKVLEKYNGMMQYFIMNDMFCCDIMLKID